MKLGELVLAAGALVAVCALAAVDQGSHAWTQSGDGGTVGPGISRLLLFYVAIVAATLASILAEDGRRREARQARRDERRA